MSQIVVNLIKLATLPCDVIFVSKISRKKNLYYTDKAK